MPARTTQTWARQTRHRGRGGGARHICGNPGDDLRLPFTGGAFTTGWPSSPTARGGACPRARPAPTWAPPRWPFASSAPATAPHGRRRLGVRPGVVADGCVRSFSRESSRRLGGPPVGHAYVPDPDAASGSPNAGFGRIELLGAYPDGAALTLLIAQWGPCQPNCGADLSGNGVVDFADVLLVMAGWGPCP